MRKQMAINCPGIPSSAISVGSWLPSPRAPPSLRPPAPLGGSQSGHLLCRGGEGSGLTPVLSETTVESPLSPSRMGSRGSPGGVQTGCREGGKHVSR